ncbi:TasA family protein [Nocardioides sp.]|uniref:TasA family protein n=1 Tax=Nocardioides sp. TaxID=35761 RepID=UPI0035696747
MTTTSLRTNSAKLLATVVLVGGAASVAGLGTFGAFTSTTAATQNVATGTLTLGLTQHSTLGTTVDATNMVPGDTVQRSVTLTRPAAAEKFGSVLLTSTGSTSNVLTSDTTKGLQVSVDECSTAWVMTPSTKVLTCAGTTTPIISSRPVLQSGLDLGSATTSLNSGAAAANLRVTMSLPVAADNSFQGKSNAITFTFDATQRAAEAR